MRLALFGLLALAACQSTPAELRAAATPTVLTSELPYEEAYRRIVTPMRNCYQGSGLNTHAAVNADLYTDIRRGEIGLVGMAQGFRFQDALIEIVPAGAGSTVTVRERAAPIQPYAITRMIPTWLAGSEAC
jgi:hypothetical protein